MILKVIFAVVFALFAAGQLRSLLLLAVVLFFRRAQKPPPEFPMTYSVLIQIPAYNEGWEMKDAVLAALNQDYPVEKLAVQVIDDSPSPVPELAACLQAEAAKLGISFRYLCRPHRQGYKSGALNYGLQFSSEDLVVILDADFAIEPGFVKACAVYFADEKVAGVQTRWAYRNQFSSSITVVQAIIFETIFALEQNARQYLRLPALFTGTSGMWRRHAITALGGWRETPFTAEDIDLSLRSYHRSYHFMFIDRALSTCEAATSFIAFKNQQQRWARGVFQAGLHNRRNVLTAVQPGISKVIEISTMLNNLSPLLLVLAALTLALQILTGSVPANALILFVLAVAGPTAWSVWFAVRRYHPQLRAAEMLLLLKSPLLLTGLAWSMLRGMLEVGMRSEQAFVVTPKGKNRAQGAGIKFRKPSLGVLLELMTFIWFGAMTLLSWRESRSAALLFFFLSCSGLYCFWSSLRAPTK